MLEELSIENLGVISKAVVSFASGLTVITGETGAGKTMVLTSLGLLTGAKPDAGKVRAGSERAHVEGLFAIESDGAVQDLVLGAGGEVEEGAVLLSRTVPAKGRSRAFAGGHSVPAGILRQAGEFLVAVHGQTEQLKLRSAAAQRARVDLAGGEKLGTALAAYHSSFGRYRRACAKLEDWRTSARTRQVEIEVLRSGIEQIDELAPKPNEDEQLRSQIERLTNVEDLREATAGAASYLNAEGGIVDSVGAIIEALQKATRYDPALTNQLQVASGIEADLQALARTISDYLESLQADPNELERMHERLAKITEVGRGRAASASGLLSWRKEASQRLSEIDGGSEREQELEAEVQACFAEADKLAKELTRLRKRSASALASAATRELKELAMPNAQIVVEVRPLAELGENGQDEVAIRLKPHPSMPAVDLGEGASGGELSRIMLALELSTLGRGGQSPVMVFDEVDAGIGGQAATSVGLRLARLAQNRQVIVVTHLAQVAAFGQTHIVVEKSGANAAVRQVEGEERVLELARMLSGHTDSKSARVHAAELLNGSHV